MSETPRFVGGRFDGEPVPAESRDDETILGWGCDGQQLYIRSEDGNWHYTPPPGAKLETRGAVRQSIVRMSGEILAELIGLPASARIVAVSNCEPFNVNGSLTIAVKIEDDGLRSVPGGCVIPDIHSRFTRGEFTVRQEWDGPHDGPGGYYQAVPPPVIRPDADKLFALLQRISQEFIRCNADVGAHSEVMGAILELRGLVPSLKEANEQHAAEAAEPHKITFRKFI